MQIYKIFDVGLKYPAESSSPDLEKYLESLLDHHGTPEDLDRIEEVAPKGGTAGPRYADMSNVNL